MRRTLCGRQEDLLVRRIALIIAAAMIVLLSALWGSPSSGPNDVEQRRLDQLASQVRGALVYAAGGRVRKVVIGHWIPIDLGPGDFARWSPDGRRVAVWQGGAVYVADAGGANRRKLVDGADPNDGCPIEFHPNNREIIYWRRQGGYHAVRIADGMVRRLPLPIAPTGSIRLSADGTRAACAWDNDLFAVDLAAGRHYKYARGTSGCISPDGRRLLNCDGDGRTVTIRDWDGSHWQKIDPRTFLPGGRWTAHRWSNHGDFIACAAETSPADSYVVRLSTRQVYRVTWEGRTRWPDLFVVREAPRGSNRDVSRLETSYRPGLAAPAPPQTPSSRPPGRP